MSDNQADRGSEDIDRSFLTDAGAATADELLGPDGREMAAANARRWVTRADEGWARLLTDFVMNGMYSRGVLPTSVRELCAVAALTVLARTDELEAHIRMALRSNLPEQVREVILQMAVYGGVPVALEGVRALERVLEEDEQ
jgi:alkylhydroperoxidase/carboxymuconolactone decarboxylase family protein YurZ